MKLIRWTPIVAFLAFSLSVELHASSPSPNVADDSDNVLVSTYADPTDTLDDTVGINTAIGQLSQNGATLHFDAPGIYRVSGQSAVLGGNGDPPIFVFSGYKNLTIKAEAGVTIMFTGFDRTSTYNMPSLFNFVQCDGVTLHGASELHPLIVTTESGDATTNTGLPFLQGTLVSKGTGTFTMRITDTGCFMPVGTFSPDAWAVPITASGVPSDRLALFSSAGLTFQVPAVPANGTQDVVCTFTSGQGRVSQWQANQEMVIQLGGSLGSAHYSVRFGSCTNVVARDIVAYQIPGKFMGAAACTNVTFDNVDVMPDPAHPNRKISATRDGITGNTNNGAVVIKDCDINWAYDDALPFAWRQLGAIDPGNWPATIPGYIYFSQTGATNLFAGSTVASRGPDFAEASEETATIVFSSGPLVAFDPATASSGFAASLQAGNPVYLAHTPGASLRFEDCKVNHSRNLGIRSRCPNTTVTGCDIRNTAHAGIFLGGGDIIGYPYDEGADFVSNSVVEGCYVENCGGESPQDGGYAAVMVGTAIGGTPQAPIYSTTGAVAVNTNVTISSTNVANCDRGGVHVACVGGTLGIRVMHSKFLNCGLASGLPGAPTEWSYGLYIESCPTGDVDIDNAYLGCPNTLGLNQSFNQDY